MILTQQQATTAILSDVPPKYLSAIKAHFDPLVEVTGNRVTFATTRRNLRLVEKMGVDTTGIETRSKSSVEHAVNVEKIPAMEHQRKALELYKDRKFFGLLWEMGLGKSKAALDIAAHAFAEGDIDAILIVTLKGVHEKWITTDLDENLSIPYRAFAWPTKKRRDAGFLEEDKLIVAAINYDALIHKKAFAFASEMLEHRKVFLIIDESHGMKSPKGSRTKALHKLAPKAVKRAILTGTVTPHSPLDVWSQLRFLDPSCVNGLDYFTFEKRFAIKRPLGSMTYSRKTKSGKTIERPIETVVGYKNTDELSGWLKACTSRLMKEDCLDLPDKVYRTHPFELNDDERKVYNAMKDEMISEVGENEIVSTTHALTLLLRLQQITCGFVKVDDGEPHLLGKSSSRMEALMAWVEDCHGQGVIWTTFQFNQDQIAEALGSDCTMYTGRTSPADRSKALTDFRDGKKRFFVSNPAAGGTGIDLRAARHVCYFNNSFNMGQRLQSEDRVHRIGQKFSIDYTDLAAYKTMDSKLIKVLRERREIAAHLVGDMVKNWILTPDEVDLFSG